MMISPEMYYEMHLKGKSSEQIMSVIRSLKWQIGRLKSSMENPSSDLTVIISPGEDVILYFSREYLKKAKQAYFEAGGTYAQSKSEEKVANFTGNIEFITKITFVKENYLLGYRSFIVEITDEIKIYTSSFDEKSTVLTCVDEGNEPFTKYTFLEVLEVLHIGEWRRRYSSKRFGIVEQHGLKWYVEFEYNNGHNPSNSKVRTLTPITLISSKVYFPFQIMKRSRNSKTRLIIGSFDKLFFIER